MGIKEQTQTIAALFAHELAGPIGGARQSIELLQEILRHEIKERPRAAISLQCAFLCLDSAIGIMKGLRQLGNPDKSKVSLAQTIKIAWAIVSAQTKNAEMRFNTSQDYLIKADPYGLIELWMNLFLNATQINKRGTVISITLQAKGKNIVVTVLNTGKPLPKGLDIFARGKGTRKGGSGLGLHICRQVAESHGGKISAQNSDEGPAFTIELKAK